MAIPDEALIERLNACAQHARELVTAAQVVSNSGQHNIAYHLAVLALEEIGKRELIGVESVTSKSDTAPAWPTKHQLDHQQKLFWCFFGGQMFRHSITKEEFEGARNLSRTMHMKRLSALYVDVNADSMTMPSLAVTRDETEMVLRLADVRVSMAESEKRRDEIPEDEEELQRWFLRSTEDQENRKLIFSQRSMEKLVDLDDTPSWVRWLKDQFSERERAGELAIAAELERGKSAPPIGTKLKWKVRFRVSSAALSVRPNVLTDWNQSVGIIKLSPVSGGGEDRKRELIVELQLRDNVPIQAIYYHAWGVARHFVVALNIATLGFWWWGSAKSQQNWFEHIEDVEQHDFRLRVDDTARTIDWGERRALNADDISRLKLTFSALTLWSPDQPYGPFDAYIAALTYLGAADIHLPLEREAFGHFIRSLQLMMIETGEITPSGPIEPALKAFVEERNATNLPELADMLSIVRAFDESARGGRGSGPRLKADYVAILKAFVDWYFLEKLQPVALARLAQKHSANEV
ncbi:AbiV family abortive infection protein [Mesorhizobium marinum]|uniref:AbiV family abortive infection protein n=1 Tax=Mesorhizobium marinum TaxID=3228790 RepID=A0ABV3QW02_9HYPH